MHILLIGSGGREHALAWKLAASDQVSCVTVAPGNPSMTAEAKVSLTAISVTDIDGLEVFAKANDVSMTVVGPEAPLVKGLVDRFEAAKLPIIGPKQAESPQPPSPHLAAPAMR